MTPRRTTVAELIKMLSAHDPDMPVLVDGYENGFDHLHQVEVTQVTDRGEPESWEGQAVKPEDLRGAGSDYGFGDGMLSPDVPAGEPYQAVLIRGRRGEHRKPETP